MAPQLRMLLITVASFASTAALPDCLVTSPSSSPVALRGGKGAVWYGSDALAVLLPSDGKWKGSPRNTYGGKLWLWRRGYEATFELRPALIIEGVKLDAGNEPGRVHIDNATNGMGDGWSAMLVGLEFPSSGCWQVTATYTHIGIRHELTFVLEVVAE
jgi:hypothetical protein